MPPEQKIKSSQNMSVLRVFQHFSLKFPQVGQWLFDVNGHYTHSHNKIDSF